MSLGYMQRVNIAIHEACSDVISLHVTSDSRISVDPPGTSDARITIKDPKLIELELRLQLAAHGDTRLSRSHDDDRIVDMARRSVPIVLADRLGSHCSATMEG